MSQRDDPQQIYKLAKKISTNSSTKYAGRALWLTATYLVSRWKYCPELKLMFSLSNIYSVSFFFEQLGGEDSIEARSDF